MGEDVKVKVSTDVSPFKSGLAEAKEAVNSFKENTADGFKDVAKDFAGLFAVGALLEGLKSVSEEMDRVEKLAKRFGETAETMQRVGESAKLNGTDLETVSKAMFKVTTNAVEAGRKGGDLEQAFKDLGISAEKFADLPLEEKLKVLGDAYNENSSGALKAEASQKILGKSAQELIPLLKQGGDVLQKQFDSASVASNETVAKIAEANEKVIKLFTTLKTWGANSISFLFDAFTNLGEGIAKILTYVDTLITTRSLASAKQAVAELTSAYDQLHDEEQKKRDEAPDKTEEGKTEALLEAEKEAEKEKQEADRKAKETASEIKRLTEEAGKKEIEDYISKQTHAERLLDIEKRLTEIRNTKPADKLQALKLEVEGLDLNKEAKKITEDQTKEKQKHEQHEKQIVIEKDKSKLSAGKDHLKDLEEHKDHFSVDSLRSIGGGLAGVNYSGVVGKKDEQKQAIDLQKKANEKLEKIIKALEDANKTPYTGAGDGSFTLS